MGYDQMLRVSSDVWERALHSPAMAIDAPGEVVIIRAGGSYRGEQGMSLATGVSSRSAGARALCLHLLTMPPGTRGVPHLPDWHESAIYTVSGQTEVWHGEDLRHRAVVRAGDFMYIPPGTPHLPVNRGDVTTVAVVARTDPQEQESVVILGLPPHLCDLDAFPIASQPGGHGGMGDGQPPRKRGVPGALRVRPRVNRAPRPPRLPRLRAPRPPRRPTRGRRRCVQMGRARRVLGYRCRGPLLSPRRPRAGGRRT
jgi:uncharacterized RmlC-like cupin family protein